MQPRLHKVTQPTNRWCNYAYSPLDFSSKNDRAKPTVVVHPGWAASPRMHGNLLMELAEADFFPVAVNTRHGYANQPGAKGYHVGANAGRLFLQSYRVGSENPYFQTQSRADNRYRLRRPTGLISLCQFLGIEVTSLVGYSDGGRIVTTVAAESDTLLVPHLLVVNAAGSGGSDGGARRVIQTSLQTARNGNDIDTSSLRLRKAAESTAYTITHGRRFNRERQVIQTTNLWPMLGAISSRGTEVTVFHAREDQLVDYESSHHASRAYPSIDFVPTEGGHSNIYAPDIRAQLVHTLAS